MPGEWRELNGVAGFKARFFTFAHNKCLTFNGDEYFVFVVFMRSRRRAGCNNAP